MTGIIFSATTSELDTSTLSFLSSTFAIFGPGVKELDIKNICLSIFRINIKNKWNFTSTITVHLHSVVFIQKDTFVQENRWKITFN
jgi:hypothetical protein